MTLYLSLEIRALVIIMSTARSSLAEPLSGAKFNTIIHPQQFDGDFFFFFFLDCDGDLEFRPSWLLSCLGSWESSSKVTQKKMSN